MSTQEPTPTLSPTEAALWEAFTGSNWDLAETFALLRDNDPVLYMPALNMWAVSRYDDVVVALRDHERFGHLPDDMMGAVPADLAEELPAGYALSIPTLVNTDPPTHNRIRKLAQKSLTPRAVARFEALIRRTANGLIDGFVADGHADLAEQFALPLPVTVMANILGFPDSDHARFKRWILGTFELFVPTLPAKRRHELALGQIELNDYVHAAIEKRRSDPDDDIISGLIRAAEGEGERSLSDLEILGIITQLTTGGFETTQGTIGLALVALCEHPEVFEQVRADPRLLPAVIEETIRRYNPARGVFRVAKSDVEISGRLIPKDSRIFVLVGAANLDPEMFAAPREFDIKRDVRNHVGFGTGVHSCPGMALARLDIRIALELLVARLPNLRLVPDQQRPLAPGFIFCTPQHLEFEWDTQ
ncbi:cytochrome P450 [Mycobacterium sp.]|uniref:cytochrome P450 n=1 Tax=Mycobacterium sp. TaxID=1785 RepID=UPI0025E98AC8|nr:cytochrome P450 [Mycobacterium sp.]